MVNHIAISYIVTRDGEIKNCRIDQMIIWD